mgnify:CR=1 FL=1
MAKISFKGLEDYELRLSKLADRKEIERIAGQAIYEGAAIMADEIKDSIEGLPVVTGYGTESNPIPGGVTAVQKAGLIDGLGIAPMQDDAGFLNVKIGFDGYNRTKTEKYRQGQPNQLVARGVESGTSWKQAHHSSSPLSPEPANGWRSAWPKPSTKRSTN